MDGDARGAVAAREPKGVPLIPRWGTPSNIKPGSLCRNTQRLGDSRSPARSAVTAPRSIILSEEGEGRVRVGFRAASARISRPKIPARIALDAFARCGRRAEQ